MSLPDRNRAGRTMWQQAVITALFLAVSNFCAAGADKTTEPTSPASNQPPAEASRDATQTNLQAGPALREQIDRTKAYLDGQETEVDGQISRLKSDGLIDRRSTTKIKSALDQARGSMTGMAEGMQSDKQYDGWTARMIAYELGMAADTLTLQADKIESEVGAAAEGRDQSRDDNSANRDQRLDLITTLRETSSLLHKAARAIAGNVR